MAGRLLVRCPTLWKSQPLLTSRVCEQMKDAQIVCFQYMDFGLDWIGLEWTVTQLHIIKTRISIN